MQAMLLSALLLLLGVRGTAGHRISGNDIEGMAPPESLAQRMQLLRALGVVGKAKRKDAAKCETEVQGDAPVVVMLSGTGEGKSTTTCVLSRDPALALVADENKAESETSESCIHRTSWFFPYDHSEPLYLVDTPGFGDTRGGEVIKKNNDDIVATLKNAAHVHAILWVLNSQNPKMEKGRQDAFRFVRSYFGRDIYKHLVFVYTRFSWRRKKARGKYLTGEPLKKALMEKHHNTMEALLKQVETEFWPGGIVGQGVHDTIMQLPCFAFNTHTMVDEDDGSVVFNDKDIRDDDWDETDPDEWAGAFNPETFKAVTPNSATQLRDLKAKIVEISRLEAMDVTNLRPFQEGCEAALTDRAKTDLAAFGQHVTDCVEGQQYKLLKDKVVPYVHDTLEDGPVVAAFGVIAYTEGRGPKGRELRADAMKELGIPDDTRREVEAFTSYDAYASCRDAAPSQNAAALVKTLSTCLGGMASGHGTPASVQAMKQRFFGDEAKSAMSMTYIAKVVAEIGKLPEQERTTVKAHMNFESLSSRRVPLAIKSLYGIDLGKTKVLLSASTTRESIISTVNQHPNITMLREQEWVDKVFLYASDETPLISNEDLLLEITEILGSEDDASVALVAKVKWTPGSPPEQLDPQLLKICLQKSDPGAAKSLVRDHVTNPKMLVFTEAPEQVMLHTNKDHGAVFKDVVALRKAEVAHAREDTKADRTQRMEDRERLIEEVAKTRQALQPYLDEIKTDAADRTREATALQQDTVAKVNRLLAEVQSSTRALKLPTEVPRTATPQALLAFTAKLDEDLSKMEDVTSDKLILGVEEVIWQSRVLKGMYIGKVWSSKSAELIQITEVPPMLSILTPPSRQGKLEVSSRSAKTVANAKQMAEQGGNSFALSVSASGVGMGSAGIGAVHTAAKVSASMEERKHFSQSSRKETYSYRSLRATLHPVRLLELGDKNVRLTTAFVARAASILHKNETRWPDEINSLFQFYGTHYCPSVELGGTSIAEAKFESTTSFTDTQADNAMSKCFSAEAEISGGAFFGAGFGKASGSARGDACKADSTNETNRTQEMMENTWMKRECISGMNVCPANDNIFIAGLKINSNWAVIDRDMKKCVAVWEALNSKQYTEELLQSASDPPPGRAAPTAASVAALREMMYKVWNLWVLDLPALCAQVMGDDEKECQDVAAVASGLSSKNIELPRYKVTKLWEKVKRKANDILEFDKGCSEMDWCNQQYGQGECKWKEMATMARTMTCECEPMYSGDFCDEATHKLCADVPAGGYNGAALAKMMAFGWAAGVGVLAPGFAPLLGGGLGLVNQVVDRVHGPAKKAPTDCWLKAPLKGKKGVYRESDGKAVERT